MSQGFPDARQSLFVVVVAATIWFALLGFRDLIDPDEGRYAEIPREMLASGDWITPRLEGLKYFEKPPLQYWLTAATFAAFGENNVSARLWVAVAGFAGALWTAWLAGRLFGRAVAAMTFLIGASSLLYVAMGHVLTLDMSLTLFLTLAMGSLALAQTQRDAPARLRAWMLLGWAALAAAVLAKGPVAVLLAGGAVAVYVLWQRDWAMLRALHCGKGLVLLLALTAPWFIAVVRSNPDFAQFFFVHEHWDRFTTDAHGRDGPIYYFAGILLIGAMPWTMLTLRALLRPQLVPRRRGGFQPERLFWTYVWVVLIFFSVSHSKLPAYILPAWPFLAMLGARRAAALTDLRPDGWTMLAFAASLATLTAFLPRFATDSTPLDLLDAFRPWVLAAAAGFAGAGLALLSRGSVTRSMATAALSAMLSVQCLAWGAQSLAPSRSGREIADGIAALGFPEQTPIYFVGHYSPSLAFYLARIPIIADYQGELTFGADAEPERVIADPEGFAERWRREAQAIAVIETRHERELDADLPMHRVDGGPRRTLAIRDRSTMAGERGADRCAQRPVE